MNDMNLNGCDRRKKQKRITITTLVVAFLLLLHGLVNPVLASREDLRVSDPVNLELKPNLSRKSTGTDSLDLSLSRPHHIAILSHNVKIKIPQGDHGTWR